MTSFLFEGRAARGRCQNVIKCDDFHIKVFAYGKKKIQH